MEYIKEWIHMVVLYWIWMSVVLTLVPSQQYKKYIQFFLSILLLLYLGKPILDIFCIQGEELLSSFDEAEELYNYEETIENIEREWSLTKGDELSDKNGW